MITKSLNAKKKETQEMIDDENATSESKQAAADRMIDIDERMERLRPQIQERQEAVPLRERVKNIFKKYGWTLQAVVLAAGLVLGAFALAGLKGLKADTQAVGKGLKNIGQNLGSLLPGLIGSIVSFIFRSAGQVLSFLGEHAWLLILAFVAFFMERLLKKRRRQQDLQEQARQLLQVFCLRDVSQQTLLLIAFVFVLVETLLFVLMYLWVVLV